MTEVLPTIEAVPLLGPGERGGPWVGATNEAMGALPALGPRRWVAGGVL